MGIRESKKANADTDDDDDDHPNTIVLANKLDLFTFDQVSFELFFYLILCITF